MRLNKITVALAAAAAAGASGSVHAATFLSGDPGNFAGFSEDGPDTYASEIDASGGTVLTEKNQAFDIATKLGFGVSAGATRFVRYDFSSAIPSMTSVTVNDLLVRQTGATAMETSNTMTGGAIVASGQISVVEGGNPGDSFVIFEFTAANGVNDISLQANAEVVLKNDFGVTVESTTESTAQYRLFETGTAASNEGTELASASGTYIDFAPALNVQVQDDNADFIDVESNSQNFDDDDTDTVSAIGEVDVNLVSSPVPLWTDGASTGADDIIGSGATLEVNADFSAVPEAGGSPDPAQVTLGGTGADTLTTSKATFLVDGTSIKKLFGNNNDDKTTGADGVIAMNVTGNEPIPETPEITASYDPAPPTTAKTSVGDLGVIGSLVKNGSTATTNLNLDPDGVFRNFVRITNRSGISGDTFITVFNDGGDSVAINLSDIQGQSDNQIAAQASTGLIPIGDIFDAAQAADSSFGLTSSDRNKLRITVEGEYPDIAVDNIAVARDNNIFNKFN